MKILITGGGTREYLDGVRYFTNISSGTTASRLADELSSKGHEVVYVHGEGAVKPAKSNRLFQFVSASDLEGALMRILGEERFDAVVHAAAVSDYTVSEVNAGGGIFRASRAAKIGSDHEKITVVLHRNHKILPHLKSYAAMGEPVIVGFKLTATDDRAEWVKAVNKLYEPGTVDWVVHNDLSDMKNGEHHFRLISRDGKVQECRSAGDLSVELDRILRSRP
jgi:phosphopantothenoylcysteine synthetase/decarboxylase